MIFSHAPMLLAGAAEDEPEGGAFDLSTAAYSGQATGSMGVPDVLDFVLSVDGTRSFLAVFAIEGLRIIWIDLDPPWELSTEVSQHLEELSPNTIESIAFKSDGAKMFGMFGFVTAHDEIYQYTLSTPWDVGTATYDSVSFDISGQDSAPVDIAFSTDGSRLFLLGSGTDTVYQYTLTTPWDLSSASYDSVSFSVSSQESAPLGVAFSADGSKMYVCGESGNIYQYSLSSAWDLSTASYDAVSFDVSNEDPTPRSLFIRPDGSELFILGQDNQAIYKYIQSP